MKKIIFTKKNTPIKKTIILRKKKYPRKTKGNKYA